MIKAITDQLRTALAARGCPVSTDSTVLYGPERAMRGALTRTRVVIERDRKTPDSIQFRTEKYNPRLVLVRGCAAVCRIYARSEEAGAAVHDHERLAEQLADMILVELRKIVVARKTVVGFAGGRFLSFDELQALGQETWPGVVYEFQFSVDRGVYDRTWQGSAKPVATVGPAGIGVATTCDAIIESSEAAAEHPCGGHN